MFRVALRPSITPRLLPASARLSTSPRFDDNEDAIDESILSAPADSLFGDGPRPYDSLPPNPSEPEYASALIHGRSIHLPYYHPQTHAIPAATIQFRSHHTKLLDLFTHFASHAASALAIPISRVAYLPTQRSLWTVPRSPFAHKKSQENFERKVHKRAIKAYDADPEVILRWTRYLRRHALGGVGMRVVTWERMPLGIGASRLAAVMEGLNLKSSDRIKQLGDKIVELESAAIQQDADKKTPRVQQ